MSTVITNVFPALRARLGDRWYYITTLTFSEVSNWIKPVDEIHERKEFKTWLQRIVREERKSEIANYLITQKQRFFNAIVAGIYQGEPEWIPVELGQSVTAGDLELGERESTAYGVIKLSGTEEIFAIDGQHRVEGIREAVRLKKNLKNEEVTVIFVGHTMTDLGRERTRRLFTTLNKFAKPVSRAELIALNDDDTFAIVTRRLIDEYPGLGSAFVPLTPTPNLPITDRTSITSVIALYDIVRAISLKVGSREAKSLEIGPPNAERVSEIFDLAITFWDALKYRFPEIKAACASQPSDQVAGKYRTARGGHILFRSVGLQAFAKATRAMMDREQSIKSAVERLSKISTELSSSPWAGVLWNRANHTMILKNQKLAVNLYLHLAGSILLPKNYPLLEKYRQALDEKNAKLPTLDSHKN